MDLVGSCLLGLRCLRGAHSFEFKACRGLGYIGFRAYRVCEGLWGFGSKGMLDLVGLYGVWVL